MDAVEGRRADGPELGAREIRGLAQAERLHRAVGHAHLAT